MTVATVDRCCGSQDQLRQMVPFTQGIRIVAGRCCRSDFAI